MNRAIQVVLAPRVLTMPELREKLRYHVRKSNRKSRFWYEIKRDLERKIEYRLEKHNAEVEAKYAILS